MRRGALLAILSGTLFFVSFVGHLGAADSDPIGSPDRQTVTIARRAHSDAKSSKDFQLGSQDGIISPVNPSQCCGGTLTADFSGASPIGKSTLSMNISANSQADSFTGCNSVSGTGTLSGKNNQFTVELFSGELCGGVAHPVRYTLTGTVGIYAGTGECPGVSGQSQTAVVSTLVAYGPVHVPGNSTNPIPGSDSSLISIVGLAGSIPLCTP